MSKPPHTARIERRRDGLFIALCSLVDAVIGIATVGRRIGLWRSYGSLLLARDAMKRRQGET